MRRVPQQSPRFVVSTRGEKTAGVTADDEQLSMLPSGGYPTAGSSHKVVTAQD